MKRYIIFLAKYRPSAMHAVIIEFRISYRTTQFDRIIVIVIGTINPSTTCTVTTVRLVVVVSFILIPPICGIFSI